MTDFDPIEQCHVWYCIWGHRGAGYATEDEALHAELSHECYGGDAA